LVQIFSIFNAVHIFEIEGETFLLDKPPNKQKFSQGLFIKLFLPATAQLSEFQKAFAEIFEYFEISHFLILPDYASGEDFLRQLFPKIDLLERYNPFENLPWNANDRKWMNVKLFEEHMVKKYPSLVSEVKKDKKKI
jgi:hypothetical protein